MSLEPDGNELSEGCVCVPQVFSRRHRGELLLAWFWPERMSA